jgi:hypothetical protein
LQSYRQKGIPVREKLIPKRELTEYQIVVGVQETGEPVKYTFFWGHVFTTNVATHFEPSHSFLAELCMHVVLNVMHACRAVACS